MQYEIININDFSDEEYELGFSLMNQSKQQRVLKYRFDEDKKRSVFGELLARRMIAERLNLDYKSIVFNQDENSKPYAENLDIEFNISHSGELVICALGDKKIGVDIEKIRDIDDKVFNVVCTNEELSYINDESITKEEKLKRFFEIWTFKEAYFKCLGTGITDLKSISFFDEKIRKFTSNKEYQGYMITIYNPE